MHSCIEQAARKALQLTEPTRAIAHLTKFISDTKESIITIGDEVFRLRVNADYVDEAAYILNKIDPRNELAISTLTERERFYATCHIGLLNANQEESLSFAKSLVWQTCFQVKPLNIRLPITPDTEKVIELLEDVSKSNQQMSLFASHTTVSKIDESREAEVAKAFVRLLCNSKDTIGCFLVSRIFTKLISNRMFSVVVKGLKNNLGGTIERHSSDFLVFYETIWHCAQNMSYPDFYRAWHSSSFADVESFEVDE